MTKYLKNTPAYYCAEGKKCIVQTKAEEGLEGITEKALLKLKDKTNRCPGCEYLPGIKQALSKYT